MVIVNNIRIPLEAEESVAVDLALKRLKLRLSDVQQTCIVKKSVDARHRSRISLVYSVGIEVEQRHQERLKSFVIDAPDVLIRAQKPYEIKPGKEALKNRPVIAGFGPAGMFAGLILSKMGYAPLVIERGADVDERMAKVDRFWKNGILDTETNVQFGEGGAGTFSDGKLTTRINDPRCETVLNELVRHGAPEEVQRITRPHIGTDKLIGIVKSIRKEIVQNGGEVRFGAKLDKISFQSGKLKSVTLNDGTDIETRTIILAIGHSARDTFEMLSKCGVMLTPKPFSVGVRIEHLQSEIDRGLYGEYAGHPSLPKGEYQLSLRQGNRAVYTFCMCPGGVVVAAASEQGGVVTNGMSYFDRGGPNANAALAVSVGPEDFGNSLFAGVEFQRKLEYEAYRAGNGSFRAPFQTVNAFIGGLDQFPIARVEPTYPVGVEPYRLDRIFPDTVNQMLQTGLYAFDRRLPGFAAGDAILTGVETRTSSPVRISRNEEFEAVGLHGVYPAGEGAGYAGGIMSAAVDGLRCAEAIIRRYSPIR
ncbi:MAG TPA: hypothetical protein VHR42_01695 [Clostridia bacterium]|nr:hypothetical protein [Clostridia bacterium]